MNSSRNNQQGFSLIELVTIIVILGVLATSMTSFMRFGVQSYTDSADREEIISNARFIVERLNREIRNALPNSMRVTGTGIDQCLEYIPINKSAVYLDIPVAPEAASSAITLAPFASANVNNSSKVSVYGLNNIEVYANADNGVIANFNPNVSGAIAPLYQPTGLTSSSAVVTLTLTNATTFNLESPTERLYFIENPVSFCFENNKVFRYENYIDDTSNYDYEIDGTPSVSGSTKVLMAQDVTSAIFKVVDATLQRNALVQLRLEFSRNLETIVFNNEIQVPNVP